MFDIWETAGKHDDTNYVSSRWHCEKSILATGLLNVV